MCVAGIIKSCYMKAARKNSHGERDIDHGIDENVNFPLNILSSSILCQGSSTCFHLVLSHYEHP
jgi:hypothetical protein